MKKNPKNSGLSLVEILAIAGVAVLITLISIPSFLGYQKNSKLKNEARQMATNIRYAQQLAITTQNVYQVKIFPEEEKRYQIKDETNNTVIKDVYLATEVRVSQIENFTDRQIRFTATGGVIEAGNIYLVNTNNQTSTLQIKPSGYVQITE